MAKWLRALGCSSEVPSSNPSNHMAAYTLMLFPGVQPYMLTEHSYLKYISQFFNVQSSADDRGLPLKFQGETKALPGLLCDESVLSGHLELKNQL